MNKAKERTCPRCAGLLTQDYLMDMMAYDYWATAMRCLNCGAILDARAVRRQAPDSLASRRRGQPQSGKKAALIA